VWVRVSLFGGVFEAKVDLTTFSFQVPAEVSSAGDFACETIATRDSTDAMMRVFRANIDFISPVDSRQLVKCAPGVLYARPIYVVSRRLQAPSIHRGAQAVSGSHVASAAASSPSTLRS